MQGYSIERPRETRMPGERTAENSATDSFTNLGPRIENLRQRMENIKGVKPTNLDHLKFFLEDIKNAFSAAEAPSEKTDREARLAAIGARLDTLEKQIKTAEDSRPFGPGK